MSSIKTNKLHYAAAYLLTTLENFGNWDDGCFYYNDRAAPELQKPMRDLAEILLELTRMDIQ